MIAEQVASHRMFVKTHKNGTRVIVDPALTASRMYNCAFPCVSSLLHSRLSPCHKR